MLLSVVMPVYNEAATIQSIVDRVSQPQPRPQRCQATSKIDISGCIGGD